MGSYNVSCFVTNITIQNGDNIVFIPIKPAKYKDTDNSLRFLPVFGVYFEGTLDNIEETESTKLIEGYYSMKIHGIVNAIESGTYRIDNFEMSRLLKSEIKNGLTYAWCLREVYDDLAKNFVSQFININTINLWDDYTHDDHEYNKLVPLLKKMYMITGKKDTEKYKNVKLRNKLLFLYKEHSENNDKLHKEICNWKSFFMYIRACNIALKPYISIGTQFGSPRRLKHLLALATKINNKLAVHKDLD